LSNDGYLSRRRSGDAWNAITGKQLTPKTLKARIQARNLDQFAGLMNAVSAKGAGIISAGEVGQAN